MKQEPLNVVKVALHCMMLFSEKERCQCRIAYAVFSLIIKDNGKPNC